MSMIEALGRFFAIEPQQPRTIQLATPTQVAWQLRQSRIRETKVQTRAIDSYTSQPGLEAQLLAVQGLTDRPWRYPSIREALGVPAIFRAATLISNTTGSLSVEAYRKGALMPDEDAPRVIKRPDPFNTPRTFYRDTAFHLATRGEFWWWVAARDIDGQPLSLIVVPPWEVTVESSGDRLRPTIKWLGKDMRREDMRHVTYLPDEGGFRGVGPLQMCGAAISVAVEAQEWAANFFAEGGNPSTIIKATGSLGPDPVTGVHEADTLRAQWMTGDQNTPKVIDEGIEEVTQTQVNTHGSQMLQAREYQNGDAARMFGIPGSMLEYSVPGSSLTYQNLESEFTKFVRTCLAPDYLEPIEQEMSDLLTRSTVARFNTKGFLRADVKTRAEVYDKLIPLGVMSVEYAQQQEGILPGDTEYAPVPAALPQAVPASLPIQMRAQEWRCSNCGKKLAEEEGNGTRVVCRCGTSNVSAAPMLRSEQPPIRIEPTIVMPSPAPMTVNVEAPKFEQGVEAIAGHMATMTAGLESTAENLNRLAGGQELVQSRLDDVVTQQSALRAKLDIPPKPKTFVPTRDERGVIVSVSEA